MHLCGFPVKGGQESSRCESKRSVERNRDVASCRCRPSVVRTGVALWLILVLGSVLAAGDTLAAPPQLPHPSSSGSNRHTLPISEQQQHENNQNQQQQHQQQSISSSSKASFSTFLSSLPPTTARSPHEMLLRRDESREPTTAAMRCLVAGQSHGGRGKGSDSSARTRGQVRGSSLEEEVRRNGSCMLGFGANDAGQRALGHCRSTRVPQLAEGAPCFVSNNTAASSTLDGGSEGVCQLPLQDAMPAYVPK